MAYSKYYPNGWADNEAGGTPITAASLNHMEDGIAAAQQAAENAAGDASQALTDAKKYSDANLKAAKEYSNTNLAAAKKYSDDNLKTAKSYTDARETVINGKISANASAISALDTRLGGLTFVINADDLGLDIVID